MSPAIAFHVLAAGLWLGGLFFAQVMLRPHRLVPDPRFSFRRQALGRFFVVAWISIAIVLLSGIALVFLAYGGFGVVPRYVRAMMAFGILAALVYAYLYVLPWRRFRRAVSLMDWANAERKLGQVRWLVSVTVVLSAAAAALGAAGRYFG